MSEIFKTKDYEIFKKHESNRSIDESNLKRVVNSIKASDLLRFRPILVDDNMRVIDGQHRLEAAKLLDLDIYYQKQEGANHEDIFLLNQNQKKWTAKDYLNYQASLGNTEYLKIKEFIEKNNLSIPEYIACTKVLGNSQFIAFSSGKMKSLSQEEEETAVALLKQLGMVLDLIKRYCLGKNLPKSKKMNAAILRIFHLDGFDLETFLKKIIQKAESIHKCPDYRGYLTMFINIYNYKNPNPIDF